jgi:hypothetical protein
MEDERDYRLAAANALERAQQIEDPDVADAYRGLAEAYLVLARFREQVVPKLPAATVDAVVRAASTTRGIRKS